MIVTQICACGILMTVGNNACAREDERKPSAARAPVPVQFCVYAAGGAGCCTREEGVGVMATCNNIVDSYCFVIGRHDATRRDAMRPLDRPNDAAAGAEYILCAEVVLLEISRGPLRDFRNFSVRVADVTTRRFSTFAFYRRTFFLRFFLNSFLYFFSRANDIV